VNFKKVIVSVSLFLLALGHPCFATHIVGGEIYYKCLGNNDYEVTLKVYRDCINGQAPFDNPAAVGVYDANGTLITTLMLPLPGSTPLPVTLNNPCYVAPANVCVEEAIYVGNVNLPPLAGGYYLAYQRCCRNNTILNLVNPGNVGATYMGFIPDPATVSCNSAPHYNNFPPLFLCAGLPLVFDHSATDPDGDSLAYELCDPYDGATAASPMPVPPAAPPYGLVPFDGAAGYSGSYPMSANPALTIDPVTGLLTGTPNMIGQWVVGVCVKEYRQGVLLSTNKRDFQFNVTNCPNVTVSAVPSQQTFCFGFTVNFSNQSMNANGYRWDFGDPAATNDTSRLVIPAWTYSAPGTYTVMLIASPGLTCADTSYSVFKIDPLLQPSFVPPPSQCLEGNAYNFAAGGAFQGGPGTNFTWQFGPGSNPPISNDQNPAGVNFLTQGVHTVTLTINENGCVGSYVSNVTVNPMATATFNMAPLTSCPPFTVVFKDNSNPAGRILNYNWTFGDGNTSTLSTPTNTYVNIGSYNVSVSMLATNAFGCNKWYNFNIPNAVTVNPIPHAEISANPLVTSIFEPEITFTDLSSNGINCSLLFGDGNTFSGCNFGTTTHTYSTYGMFQATQILMNGTGCTDTFRLDIEIKPEYRYFVPNAFTINNDGLNEIFAPSIMGVRDYDFSIFDRWGKKIFETNSLNHGWDGTFKGDPCQQDVYVYKIKYIDEVDNKYYSHLGRVALLR